jgi:hypothetical protein
VIVILFKYKVKELDNGNRRVKLADVQRAKVWGDVRVRHIKRTIDALPHCAEYILEANHVVVDDDIRRRRHPTRGSNNLGQNECVWLYDLGVFWLGISDHNVSLDAVLVL